MGIGPMKIVFVPWFGAQDGARICVIHGVLEASTWSTTKKPALSLICFWDLEVIGFYPLSRGKGVKRNGELLIRLASTGVRQHTRSIRTAWSRLLSHHYRPMNTSSG